MTSLALPMGKRRKIVEKECNGIKVQTISKANYHYLLLPNIFDFGGHRNLLLKFIDLSQPVFLGDVNPDQIERPDSFGSSGSRYYQMVTLKQVLNIDGHCMVITATLHFRAINTTRSFS